jgi:hypothetical protein
MAHEIIIIIDAIDEMKGNATSGTLVNLRTAAAAVDTAIGTNSYTQAQKTKMHNKLKQVQDFLKTNAGSPGTCTQVVTFTNDLNGML